MTEHKFRVPLPPSDNKLYANNPKIGRGRYESKECKIFKKQAPYHFWQAKLPRKQTARYWSLVLHVHMDQRRYAIRDLSNCFKALIDSLSEYIGSDDRFLIGLIARKVKTSGVSSIEGVLMFEDP